MKTFEMLPAEVRRAVAMRELRRRGLATTQRSQLERAVAELGDALRALLPDDTGRPVYVDGTRLLAVHQPQNHTDKRHALLGRVQARAATADDARVLGALPAPALAVMGLTAVEYLAMVCSIDDRV